jgi:hypothetical protein
MGDLQGQRKAVISYDFTVSERIAGKSAAEQPHVEILPLNVITVILDLSGLPIIENLRKQHNPLTAKQIKSLDFICNLCQRLAVDGRCPIQTDGWQYECHRRFHRPPR